MTEISPPSVTEQSLSDTEPPAFSSPSVTAGLTASDNSDPRSTRAIVLDIERKISTIEAFVTEIAEDAKPAIDQLTGSGIFRLLIGNKR